MSKENTKEIGINTRWLLDNTPVDASFTEDGIELLKEFALLWCYSECYCFNENASRRAVTEFVKKVRLADTSDGRIPSVFRYFKTRYFEANDDSKRLDSLCPSPRAKDIRKRMIEINDIGCPNALEQLEFALLVVYRLRNNLFHGVKAQYAYQDQIENFEQACELLKAVCELPTQ